MKIPRRFTIMGQTWRVTVTSRIPDDADGLTVADRRVIHIRKGLSDKDAAWTFWHEWQHAFLHELGVARADVGIPDMAEEMICDQFANWVTQNVEIKFKRRKRK